MMKWWKDFKKKDMARRTPGLAEKEAAMKRKLDVAMSILDRRKEALPVDIDRRKLATN